MISPFKVLPPRESSLLCIDLWEFPHKPNLAEHQYQLCINTFEKYGITMSSPILQGTYDLGSSSDKKIFSDTYKWINYQKIHGKQDISKIDWYLETLFHHVNNSYDNISSHYYDSVPQQQKLNPYFYNFDNILVLSKESLELVCEINSIKNIVIMGSAWEVCVHERPVGLNALKSMNLNVYVIPSLVWSMTGHIYTADIEKDPLTFHRCTSSHEMYKLANE